MTQILVHVMIRATLLMALTDFLTYVAADKDEINTAETEISRCLRKTDFAELVNCGTFVDKTLLIKMLLEKPPAILITAPKGYGKSANLNMLKRFLEIVVDEKGVPQQVEETENYRLFTNSSLEISYYPELIETYLGQYPVLFIDFVLLRGCKLKQYSDFNVFLRMIIRNTFLQYKYILQSKNVNDIEKVYFANVCGGHKLASHNDLRYGLQKLICFIHNHFKKKVIVLVDNYDAYIDNVILMDVSSATLPLTLGFFANLFENMFNDFNHVYSQNVFRAILTGVIALRLDAYVRSGFWTMDTNFRWLGGHSLFTFYGLMPDEAWHLFSKFGPDYVDADYRPHILPPHVLLYYGHNKCGRRVFSWSILRYLQTKENTTATPVMYDHLKRYLPLFEIPEIKLDIQNMLTNKRVRGFKKTSFYLRDFEAIKDMLASKIATERTKRAFYYFLSEHGYLTVTGFNLHIANMEVESVFRELLNMPLSASTES